jgi:hypothetical protein
MMLKFYYLADDEAKESEFRKPEKKAEFSNLNEKHTEALSKFITEKKALLSNLDGDEEAMRRKKARQNLYFVFIEALEECKQNNEEDPEKYEEFESLGDIMVNKELSFNNADKLASNFANYAETSVTHQNSSNSLLIFFTIDLQNGKRRNR